MGTVDAGLDGWFALWSLLLGFVGALSFLVRIIRHKTDSVFLRFHVPAYATLLFLIGAFSQDVVAFWLSAVAYAIFAVSFSLSGLFERLVSRFRDDVVFVVLAFLKVVRYTAFVDLALLVILALIERVIPYYVSLV